MDITKIYDVQVRIVSVHGRELDRPNNDISTPGTKVGFAILYDRADWEVRDHYYVVARVDDGYWEAAYEHVCDRHMVRTTTRIASKRVQKIIDDLISMRFGKIPMTFFRWHASHAGVSIL